MVVHSEGGIYLTLGVKGDMIGFRKKEELVDLGILDPWTLSKMHWVVTECQRSSPGEIDALEREILDAYKSRCREMEAEQNARDSYKQGKERDEQAKRRS